MRLVSFVSLVILGSLGLSACESKAKSGLASGDRVRQVEISSPADMVNAANVRNGSSAGVNQTVIVTSQVQPAVPTPVTSPGETHANPNCLDELAFSTGPSGAALKNTCPPSARSGLNKGYSVMAVSR